MVPWLQVTFRSELTLTIWAGTCECNKLLSLFILQVIQKLNDMPLTTFSESETLGKMARGVIDNIFTSEDKYLLA